MRNNLQGINFQDIASQKIYTYSTLTPVLLVWLGIESCSPSTNITTIVIRRISLELQICFFIVFFVSHFCIEKKNTIFLFVVVVVCCSSSGKDLHFLLETFRIFLFTASYGCFMMNHNAMSLFPLHCTMSLVDSFYQKTQILLLYDVYWHYVNTFRPPLSFLVCFFLFLFLKFFLSTRLILQVFYFQSLLFRLFVCVRVCLVCLFCFIAKKILPTLSFILPLFFSSHISSFQVFFLIFDSSFH